MSKQKFKRGDVVRISKILGSSMSHFPSDSLAIVIGSYKDQYGGNDTKQYTLDVSGRGPISWYEEEQLTLVEASSFPSFKQYCQRKFKDLQP